MKVVLTGARGFLGWHTRCRLHALTDHEVFPITRATWEKLPSLAHDADAIIHTAGINRGQARVVREGNVALARDVAHAISLANKPPIVVYANSIQAGNGTPYGEGKSEASEILQKAARSKGSKFFDLRLPNLFGEHGLPGYNSFVATFIDALVHGRAPQVTDRSIELLHAQDAAQALMDGLTAEASHVHEPPGHPSTVARVWETLCRYHDIYHARGDIPSLTSDFDVALFNSYRAATFSQSRPIALTQRSDARGRLVETVRSHGGQGQSFVSTTVPGVSRGDHYHLTKIERFAVLAGEARIALRRLFSDEVVDFIVSGDDPVAIDMPTLWTHSITNIGTTEVLTQFWTHELFDPARPDTFWVKVDSKECSR